MKNTPRLYIDAPMAPGGEIELSDAQRHYLVRVMRREKFLAFRGGLEFEAELIGGAASARIIKPTNRPDPKGAWTLYFAPIKRAEDIVSAATQLGAGTLCPVITDYTTARHINWDRIRKIIVEAAEQCGLNSLPELREPISFAKLDKSAVFYGDERAAHGAAAINKKESLPKADDCKLLIGPEGGFSDDEFAALDAAGATGVALGPTILRSEVAAVALAARVLPNR